MLASPSGEENNVPSQPSRLIPEYANLRISGLRKSKIIQEKDKKGNGIPKVFGFIYLFASVAMSSTKSVLKEAVSFKANLIYHEERSKFSPYNPRKIFNPLSSNIKTVDDNFTFT